MGCSGLEKVAIGKNVASIGMQAFHGCTKLTDISFKGTVEQWNAIEKGSSWNSGVPAGKVICSDGEVLLN